jgi:ABC-2 type transport system permease protein
MHKPSIPGLLWLFARTALLRFRNRFALAKQKRQEARRKKQGLPGPVRTATAHRNQRAGSIGGLLFMAYLLLMFVMMVAMSMGKTMTGVLKLRQPPSPELSAEQRVKEERRQGDFIAKPLQRMNPDTRRVAERVGGLLIMTAGLGTLLFAVGMLSRQISRPEPSLGWLFEFPVPRGVLFSSRLCECLFDGASLPLLSMMPGVFLFQSGYGFWESVGWGLAFGMVTALGIGALRIAIEVLLLQKCPRRRRGTIVGVCTAAGTLLMVVVLYGGGTPSLVRMLLAWAEALPDWFFRNPFANGFGLQLTTLPLQWLTAAGVAAVLCFGSVLFCARLTRYGLEPGLETARGPAPTATTSAGPRRPARRPRFSGLVAREIYMLVRQRAVLVQVLLAPVIMVLMLYFQSSGRFAETALGSVGALSSAIYGICAYMVLIASQVAMNTELRTLWLLLSLPRPLADALRVKSVLWGSAAAVLALVLGVLAMLTRSEMAGGLLYRLPFIVVMVALIADLSVGIRTMGSSIISETTVHFRQWAQWLPLMLSAAAGQAVFHGDGWMLGTQLVLLGALDVSVWQKLRVELPYLTEPAEDPPPRLFLMQGLLAAYGYFALQMLGMIVASAAKAPPAMILPMASAIAAGLVGLTAFWQLTRRKVPVFPDTRAPWRACIVPAVTGLVAVCVAGWGWVHLLEWLRWPPEMPFQNGHSGGMKTYSGTVITFAALAMVVAPLSEEFIFRGLVYRGLRRTCGFWWSLLWSSLFFMAVHPARDSGAVFVLAAVNAWILERTGRLTPCILVHAGYNTFVLWLKFWS